MHQMTKDSIARGQTAFECGCCGQKLKNHDTIHWVEFSNSGDGWYTLDAGLPEDQSQGCFPVGATCYRKQDVQKKYVAPAP